MTSSSRLSADVAQARYLASELERWIDQLADDADIDGPSSAAQAKRRELYEVQRQLKALRDSFPQAFS
ncbi:hypothetical protein [Williamsia limnetica]|jgi:hypothetical protein|nr:hypothetical protein [Williamsia limnetica]